MAARTTSTTVSFSGPFTLGQAEEVFPAGQYSVETVEELLETLSFTAYRRVATIMHIQPSPGISRDLTINPDDLDDALMNDRGCFASHAGAPGAAACE